MNVGMGAIMNNYYGLHFVRCYNCDDKFIIEKHNEWCDSNLCNNCTIERIKQIREHAEKQDIYFIGGPMDGEKTRLKNDRDSFLYFESKPTSNDDTMMLIKHIYKKRVRLGEWLIFEYKGEQ